MFVSVDLIEKKSEAPALLIATLLSGTRDGGTYVVGIPEQKFNHGHYLLRLRAGETTLDEPIDLR